MFDYDAELSRYHARLLAAVEIAPGDRVLDVGCGTGQTTRAAARLGAQGQCVGIDISAPMLERARQVSDLEGITNVAFECADAQVHRFPSERFTVGLSRFGTMFFTDPRAAFANIARALQPGAMFVQLVWQDRSRQDWDLTVRNALNDELGTPPTPVADGAFSLADPAKVDALMTDAGFIEVQLAEVREPVYYGADGARALDAVRSLRMTSELLSDLDGAAAERALSRLRAVLHAHDTGGVWFDSCAWLVTARRR